MKTIYCTAASLNGFIAISPVTLGVHEMQEGLLEIRYGIRK